MRRVAVLAPRFLAAARGGAIDPLAVLAAEARGGASWRGTTPEPRPSRPRPLATAPAFGRTFSERKLLGYTPQQLYDVVADVDAYSEFVPWCVGSRVLGPPAGDGGGETGGDAASSSSPAPRVLEAELRVGFRSLSEAYTSVVTLTPHSAVTSTVRGSSLFHHLDSAWTFRPGPAPRTVWLAFSVDFAFRSALHAQAAGLFFDEVATRMVAAFEARCGAVHGPPSVGRVRRPA